MNPAILYSTKMAVLCTVCNLGYIFVFTYSSIICNVFLETLCLQESCFELVCLSHFLDSYKIGAGNLFQQLLAELES